MAKTIVNAHNITLGREYALNQLKQARGQIAGALGIMRRGGDLFSSRDIAVVYAALLTMERVVLPQVHKPYHGPHKSENHDA